MNCIPEVIMKKAGIIGGIGPASTLDYYSGIISGTRAHSESEDYPTLVIDSVNMTEMMGYITANAWVEVAAQLVRAIDHLAAAGADFAVIASNTPHIVFDAIRARSRLPLISIVEATCLHAAEIGCKRAAVLGTLFTMRSGLYTKAFQRYGIEAFAPDEETQKEVYGLFFPNLENGIVIPEDRARLIEIAKSFVKSSRADALVLGCTELPLAIKPGDIDTVLLDTVQIHIEAIIREILS
jgi:aspartate racemase